jgi:hypothetical protein
MKLQPERREEIPGRNPTRVLSSRDNSRSAHFGYRLFKHPKDLIHSGH